MANLQLLRHISFAIVDGRAVFLDLRRDRYLALDGAAADAFAALHSSPDCRASEELVATLFATGLFAASQEPGELLPAQIEVPDRDLCDDAAKPAAKDLIGVLFHVIACRRAVRRQPLEIVIARRRRPPRECSRTMPADTVLGLAGRYLRARALIPIKPVCLQDSLALHDWLAVRGARSSLVLGVQLDPFAAHCWVQLGNTVLNDAADKVATYTPILVVE